MRMTPRSVSIRSSYAARAAASPCAAASIACATGNIAAARPLQWKSSIRTPSGLRSIANFILKPRSRLFLNRARHRRHPDLLLRRIRRMSLSVSFGGRPPTRRARPLGRARGLLGFNSDLPSRDAVRAVFRRLCAEHAETETSLVRTNLTLCSVALFAGG